MSRKGRVKLKDKPIDKFRKFVRAHDRLYYVYKFFRHFRDGQYFRDLNIQESDGGPNRWFRFKTYGDMNKDKALYMIRNNNQTSGLCAKLNGTFGYLTVADFFGFSPVIEWITLAYQRDVSGVENIFEHYFEQPSGISVAEAMQSYHLEFSPEQAHAILPSPLSSIYSVPSDERIALYSKAIKKFLRLNPAAHKHIYGCVESILEGKKTLGVHSRGGGFKGMPWGHPVVIELSEHIAEAKKAVAEHGFEQIFLATDEEETVKQFKQTFGDMVVCHSEIMRLQTDGKSFDLQDLGAMAIYMRDSRPEHGYKMGLEVLTDVYTLAECQGLIAGPSSVPYSALYINGGKYEYKQILYKGIYGIDVPHRHSKGDKAGHRYIKHVGKLVKDSEKQALK